MGIDFGTRIKKQSSFSRSLANEAKAGAYCTDVHQVELMRQFLKFPSEFNALEPCSNQGDAFMAILGDAKEAAQKLCVELDSVVAKQLRESGRVDDVICADFLNGVRISNNAFSFAFCNPPYMDNGDGGRMETLFLAKLYDYCMTGAVVVWVVPEYVLNDEAHQRVLLGRFTPLLAYRFQEKVYQQFKQCIIFLSAKPRIGWHKEEMERFNEMLAELSELPETYAGEEKIRVPMSAKDKVVFFTTKEFDTEKAYAELKCQAPMVNEIQKALMEPKFEYFEGARPPIPLNEGNLYTLTACNTLGGVVGSKEKRNLHLQRGVAKLVEQSLFKQNEGGSTSEEVHVFTKVINTIIENDGTITEL